MKFAAIAAIIFGLAVTLRMHFTETERGLARAQATAVHGGSGLSCDEQHRDATRVRTVRFAGYDGHAAELYVLEKCVPLVSGGIASIYAHAWVSVGGAP